MLRSLIPGNGGQMLSASELSYLARLWAGTRLSKHILPPTVRPVAASIKLTENCQSRCITCDYWKSHWEDHISTTAAIDLLNELSALGIKYLRCTGGEPLLGPDLFGILERADCSRFRRITLQTNGILLTKLHRQINDSPITKIGVSMDGLEEHNDAIRGIRGHFKLVFERLGMIRGKSVQVSATLTRRSAASLGSPG